MTYSEKKRDDMRLHLEYEEKFHPLNRVQPSWWAKHSESVGLFLWICAITIAGSVLVLTLDKVLAWGR